MYILLNKSYSKFSIFNICQITIVSSTFIDKILSPRYLIHCSIVFPLGTVAIFLKALLGDEQVDIVVNENIAANLGGLHIRNSATSNATKFESILLLVCLSERVWQHLKPI